VESAKRQSWERRRLNGLLHGFNGRGIDVGAGHRPFPWWTLPELQDVHIERVDTWDVEQGDAHLLASVPSRSYDFLFASHILEHLERPLQALGNWVRVVRPGGVLLIAVPHQHLYEGREQLPSRWNHEHLRYYLPDAFAAWLADAAMAFSFSIEALQTGDWGWSPQPPRAHPIGEYQVDALLRRGELPNG